MTTCSPSPIYFLHLFDGENSTKEIQQCYYMEKEVENESDKY